MLYNRRTIVGEFQCSKALFNLDGSRLKGTFRTDNQCYTQSVLDSEGLSNGFDTSKKNLWS